MALDTEEKQSRWAKLGKKGKVVNEDAGQFNHEQWNAKYTSNRIKTTVYTWWSFLPHSMFLQFTKVVNCFYVVNCVLQSIKSI